LRQANHIGNQLPWRDGGLRHPIRYWTPIRAWPTPEEIERLEISTGTPVAEHIRTGYTAEDRPVRIMVSIVPGDVLILQYNVPT
jgi:hypothetical protein